MAIEVMSKRVLEAVRGALESGKSESEVIRLLMWKWPDLSLVGASRYVTLAKAVEKEHRYGVNPRLVQDESIQFARAKKRS